MRYWIKLYHEILHDPKMGRLPDRLWRRCIELFLMAGEANEGGKLPDIGDIAWTLRVDQEQLQQDIDALSAIGVITSDDNGLSVTKFAERQDPDTGGERQERYRAANRIVTQRVTQPSQNVTENVTQSVTENVTQSSQNVTDCVTKPVRDIDIESDIESDPEVEAEAEAEAEKSKKIAAAAAAYEGEIGIITPTIADELRDAANVYPQPWILAAIHEAATHNARSWAYVLTILKRRKSGARDPGRFSGKPQQRDKPPEDRRRYLEDDFPSEPPQ